MLPLAADPGTIPRFRPPAAQGRAHSRLESCGAVAQLGERRVRNAKVVGSTPIGSTNFSPTFNALQY